MGLKEAVPDRSTFSRSRYGRFRERDIYQVLFENVVDQYRKAGLVSGEGSAVDSSFVHGDARRDLRVGTVDAIRQGEEISARPVREYLAALAAGSPVREGGAKYLSPTDPRRRMEHQGRRGRFGYFTGYMIDTAHAVIVGVEATSARMAREIVAVKTMLDRVAEEHDIEPDVLAADRD